MNLIQIDVSLPRLFKAAQVGRHVELDIDYLMHSFLEETFGPKIVRPFAIPPSMQRLTDQIRVVGYSDQTSEQLVASAREIAPVGFFNAIVDTPIHKPMPEVWGVGKTFCLTTRLAPLHRGRHGRGETTIHPVPGENTLEYWTKDLFERMSAVAVLQMPRIMSFCHRKSYRKRADGSHALIRMPDMWVEVVATVLDEAGFDTMIKQGLGRHKTFGYGMVLLSKVRPSS